MEARGKTAFDLVNAAVKGFMWWLVIHSELPVWIAWLFFVLCCGLVLVYFILLSMD